MEPVVSTPGSWIVASVIGLMPGTVRLAVCGERAGLCAADGGSAGTTGMGPAGPADAIWKSGVATGAAVTCDGAGSAAAC